MLTSDLMTAVEGLPDGFYDDAVLGIRIAVENGAVTAWMERDAMAAYNSVLNHPWGAEWGSFDDPRQGYFLNHEGHEG